MNKKLFRKGNVLIYQTEKTYEGQESFSIILVLSDIIQNSKREDDYVEIQDLSVNTYNNNTTRNSILFKPHKLWARSQFAADCKSLFKLKERNYFLKLTFDSLFDERK